MKKIKTILGLVLCVCMLTACGVSGGGTTPTDTAPAQTAEPTQSQSVGDPLPADNKNPAVASLGDVCPSSSADGYYVCTKVVHYYPASTLKKVVLCAQTGCTHKDSTCQAWIGVVQSYTEYLGMLYAIVEDGESVLRFVKKDLSDGTLTTIGTWENKSGLYYNVSLGKIADRIAIIYVTQTTISTADDGRPMSQQDTTIWRYDLQSGEKQVLFSGDQADELSVLAVSSKYLAVMRTTINPNTLTFEEFQAEYGEKAIYGRYLDRIHFKELRLYNADGSDYTVVANSQTDGLIPTGDPCSTYGKELVYRCNDTVFLLNLDTGKSRAVVNMENISNYWVMDHKIFLINQNVPWNIIPDPNKVVSIYVVDFDDGVPVKLGNGGNTEHMEFSIYQEGTSFFVGRWKGGLYRISKEDFYADRYENAR